MTKRLLYGIFMLLYMIPAMYFILLSFVILALIAGVAWVFTGREIIDPLIGFDIITDLPNKIFGDI